MSGTYRVIRTTVKVAVTNVKVQSSLSSGSFLCRAPFFFFLLSDSYLNNWKNLRYVK